MTPDEARKAIVEMMQFVLANSPRHPSELADMTIPQVNALAESIRKYAITAFGVGLGGKSDDAPPEKEHTVQHAMAFISQFNGLG